MPFCFIHASDLHIGRKFANIPQPPDGTLRGRLMEARHGAIATLARVAAAQGAGHVLLAGDTFDTATPSAPVIRQALAAMGDAAGVTWWLLPGNHDNLRDAEPLWETIRRDAPPNVIPLTEAAPHDMGPATLLPCPTGFKRGASDPTAMLPDMPSAEGHLRIGLAHGGVTDFTDTGGAIAPDRDQTARLDYLALGDWHGRLAVSERVQYSGSPEQDGFKHGRRGVCLLVRLDGPGAAPAITELETGQFHWAEIPLALTARQDAAAAFRAALPQAGRRDCLLKLLATGWASLPEQAALRLAHAEAAPDFGWLDLRMEGLGTLFDPEDLDQIDRAGALRMAADALMADAGADAAPQADRDVAGDALARLYSYMLEDQA